MMIDDILQQTFNTHFKRAGYDLNVWRKRCNISSEEFAILDADGEHLFIYFLEKHEMMVSISWSQHWTSDFSLRYFILIMHLKII
jgi:hypothetical protein